MKRLPVFFLTPLITVMLVMLVVTPGNAFAYIDPGAGSALLQVILAAIFGGLLFFKIIWQRIRMGFSRFLESVKSRK